MIHNDPTALWQGQIALVTGSSRGIGQEIAKALGALGVSVIVHGRDAEKIECVVKEFQIMSVRAWGIVCDLASVEDIQELMSCIQRKYGHLDILINNAAIRQKDLPLISMTSAGIDAVMKINLLGAVHVVRCALPLLACGSRIVNIGSSDALCGCHAEPVYAASKAGLLGFTTALSKKLLDKKIVINMVSPSQTNTETFLTTYCHDHSDGPFLEEQGFFTEKKDIINAVLALCIPGTTITGSHRIIPTKNGKH